MRDLSAHAGDRLVAFRGLANNKQPNGCILPDTRYNGQPRGAVMDIRKDQDRIEKVVELAAPVARVWRAITDHEEFGAWFRVRLDGPFKVGETTTGNITLPGYESMKWVSVTEELEHERSFVFSWPPSTIDPDTDYDDDAKVRVEFRLEPTESGTRVTITESGFQLFPEAKRLEVLRSNVEGWEAQAKNIAAYIAS